MVILGVDPGLSGAIGALIHSPAGPIFHRVYDMPVMLDAGTERNRVNCVELARILTVLRADSLGGCEAWVEKVHAVPPSAFAGRGAKMQQGAVGSFGLGRSFGSVEGVLAALHIPIRYVHSTVWKKALGLRGDKTKQITPAQLKELSRAKAIELLPAAGADLTRKKDEARAEALLIARHGALDYMARVAAQPVAPT